MAGRWENAPKAADTFSDGGRSWHGFQAGGVAAVVGGASAVGGLAQVTALRVVVAVAIVGGAAGAAAGAADAMVREAGKALKRRGGGVGDLFRFREGTISKIQIENWIRSIDRSGYE
jgi:hypothetical protein